MSLLLIIIILTIGFLIYTSIQSNSKECPKPEIIYRNVPRTFAQEQLDPVKPSNIFADMFNNPSVFIGVNTTTTTNLPPGHEVPIRANAVYTNTN